MSLKHKTASICLLLSIFTSAPQKPLFAAETPSTAATKAKAKPDFKAWKKHKDAANQAIAKENYEVAEASLRAALAEAENFDPDDERLAETLHNLAEFYTSFDRVAEAEPLLRREVVVVEKSPLPLYKAQAHLDLGIACLNLKNYEEAEMEFIRTREILVRALGPDNQHQAVCKFYLGQLYLQQNQLAKAEQSLKEARVIFQNPSPKITWRQWGGRVRMVKQHYLPKYNYELQTLTCLGQVYQKQGKLKQAEEALKDCASVAKSMPNGDVPEIAALDILSTFYLSTSNYVQVEKVLARLGRQNEKVYGPKHPATLKTYSVLAFAYEGGSKLAEAESTLKRSRSVREKYFGATSDEVALATTELADFYTRHDRFSDAESLYKELMDRAKKNSAPDVWALPILAQQAKIYSSQGKDVELEAVYQHQIEIYEKTFGKQNIALAKPLEDCASLLRKGKRNAEAETLEIRARTIRSASAK
jgi:tetratricopeptide (TPR) repeat protein